MPLIENYLIENYLIENYLIENYLIENYLIEYKYHIDYLIRMAYLIFI